MAQGRQFPTSFVECWKDALLSRQAEQFQDFPSHHVHDSESLITTSSPQTLLVGTGYSIFTSGIIPAILNAKTSVHFVTCYWAASPSLDAIRHALTQLAVSRRSDGAARQTQLTVTIGFSSWGLLQKLFHTGSRDGHTYPPSQWAKLGLPDQKTLSAGGVQLRVKSLFFTPFGVMHPKYVVIDEKRAFVPSCNVSWETWFEGCIELEGDVVQTLMAFHSRVWGAGSARTSLEPDTAAHVASAGRDDSLAVDSAANSQTEFLSENGASATQSLRLTGNDVVPTILLPSSHHRNPRFSFFPFLSQANPPTTPLNAALLTLFAHARRRIVILTPNITSWPVLNALLEALGRGVDVQIRTNKGMMLLEQLVTAGTTTSLCLNKFVRKYQQLRGAKSQPSDVEAQREPPGQLEILYYRPCPRRRGREDEPVVSHFKMTMVDDEYLVLGSGNMDRASWWTSQELGFLFYVAGMDWHKLWDGVLDERMELLYRS
ncbi:uncharacterized protein UV8b_00842 [Ustilaginoidea virens]|uniref:PLD phosphodiesterase domain-containing protein n=1 Tax=Ustilaginoidea virens TaxID=1159556 RepID=A0A063C0I8_USTVR|nr:uncharacterized protein UV8b_00842 [Ustilaginoidea virens]QUC16601.1 hypothetical protein UV8b_00842 [Ustilaginoidea virens]GAO18547.1 hypothetical protein UVI_02012230 [Ustilaginoidea virens]